MFVQGGLGEAISNLWAPYVRTTFVKITLRFPKSAATLASKRAVQKQVLQCLRQVKPVSRVAGSEGREIWIAKQRTPEERGRIKAIVLTKEFAERYVAEVPGLSVEGPELDWRCRVYVGAVNLLLHVQHQDPAPEDIYIEDQKGTSTGWFVSAAAVFQALGIPVGSMHEVWTRLMTPA